MFRHRGGQVVSHGIHARVVRPRKSHAGGEEIRGAPGLE
jgi:hypothetical protein